MGREIRRVIPNWEHPKRDCPHMKTCPGGKCVIPLHDQSYADARSEWIDGLDQWRDRVHKNYSDDCDYWEYYGNPPERESYRPSWNDEEKTWYQVYETVSEGTPVSPPFATKEELIDYLVAHGDFWDQRRGDGGYDRKTAGKFVYGDGWVPSMIITGGKIYKGIECENAK